METIAYAVGNDPRCPNRFGDVKTIKTLLTIAAINQDQKSWEPGKINGSSDPATLKAIKAFQTAKAVKASGIIEPSSKTMQQLNAIAKVAVKTIKLHQRPVLVAKSQRNPGKKADGTTANDMKYGDYTNEQIKNIRWNFQVDDMISDLDSIPSKVLFRSFRHMVTELFAMGELEKNILRMIAKFEENSGGTYSAPTLVRAADSHQRTLGFVNELNGKLKTVIAKYRGDISKVRPAFDVVMTQRIYFNTKRDILRGMTIATNDIWAWTVEVLEYHFDGVNYKGKYKITLYDHFGLDEPDVDYSKKYGNLAGFRAWFILQHLDRFAYKPFITVIELEKPFSGSLR
ncbi:MAG: DUF3289 family protein [Thermodesulfobacteriota bacterium]|nr:DUF3289 family protein [Thermodesulfobacteriota bacterium]